MKNQIGIIGGGAAGFFAAISIKEMNPSINVVLFEAGSRCLKKVKISGGGRCNVTHQCFDPIKLSNFYPRGQKELLSAFSQFQPQDTIRWFQSHGIELVPEEDGRIFPRTGNSQTIIDCFFELCRKHQIKILKKTPVTQILKDSSGFLIRSHEQEFRCDQIFMTTGSSPQGHELARGLGHTIEPPVPSLFTFQIKESWVKGLAGVSVPAVEVSIREGKKIKIKERGPLLMTHVGLSGPVILKASSWGARYLSEINYQADLRINWLSDPPQMGYGSEFYGKVKGMTEETLREWLLHKKKSNPKKDIKNERLGVLPKRFFQKILELCEIPQDQKWAQLSKKNIHLLSDALLRMDLQMVGKNTFKEEFVTAGGVSRKEVDFKTMQSKKTPGLFFAGEVLDIDGMTGGFNFQNAWTGGYIGAKSLASMKKDSESL